GARARDVLRMMLGQAAWLVSAGVALGLAGAMAAAQIISSMLFHVAPTDPLTLALVSLLLAAVALLACWIPARRASRVNPLVALRYE
ncbi:MAG: FtsX-like permease family protein, partial [Acidobacteria bacterium]|nr:FtsX-like permease family protein [Acidobacteriota bacterium]